MISQAALHACTYRVDVRQNHVGQVLVVVAKVFGKRPVRRFVKVQRRLQHRYSVIVALSSVLRYLRTRHLIKSGKYKNKKPLTGKRKGGGETTTTTKKKMKKKKK